MAADLAAAGLRGTGKMKNAVTFFTAEEQERIRQAVIAAEAKTSGEIVPMLVTASGRYAEVEMRGMVFGLIIGTLLEFTFYDPWLALHAQALWPLAGSLIGFLVSIIPAVKTRLIARERIAEAVHLRTLAAFTAHGLHYTKAHTGILIMASLFERRVVVLADKGINDKCPPGTWDQVVQTVTSGLKSGAGCEGFCKAIAQCGEILAQEFPRSANDSDELPDKLVTEQ